MARAKGFASLRILLRLSIDQTCHRVVLPSRVSRRTAPCFGCTRGASSGRVRGAPGAPYTSPARLVVAREVRPIPDDPISTRHASMDYAAGNAPRCRPPVHCTKTAREQPMSDDKTEEPTEKRL